MLALALRVYALPQQLERTHAERKESLQRRSARGLGAPWQGTRRARERGFVAAGG
jgi:hypothetical protein